jgi:hypothetical protein
MATSIASIENSSLNGEEKEAIFKNNAFGLFN